ncbi:MAG TPA: hypothetical protein VH796_15475 [Nitrososphaeraceae archaeon]|jgi:hypothetical protein
MSKPNIEKVQRENVESNGLPSIYAVLNKNQNDINQSGKQSSWLISMQHELCLEDRQQNSAMINRDIGLSTNSILGLHEPLGVDNN